MRFTKKDVRGDLLKITAQIRAKQKLCKNQTGLQYKTYGCIRVNQNKFAIAKPEIKLLSNANQKNIYT